eukprot:7388441-Prymnesium_polylepis.1
MSGTWMCVRARSNVRTEPSPPLAPPSPAPTPPGTRLSCTWLSHTDTSVRARSGAAHVPEPQHDPAAAARSSHALQACHRAVCRRAARRRAARRLRHTAVLPRGAGVSLEGSSDGG